MPHYVVLINWTDQGIKNVRESPQRAQAVQKAVESAGGKMEVYYTLGIYDIVAFVDMPSDEDMASVMLSVGSLGNVRTTTLKAFTVEEFRQIINRMPTMAMR